VKNKAEAVDTKGRLSTDRLPFTYYELAGRTVLPFCDSFVIISLPNEMKLINGNDYTKQIKCLMFRCIRPIAT
jgi:hypothetical protein